MTKTRLFHDTRAVFAVLRSASAVAAAVENRAAPRPSDLIRLGVDPKRFGSIRQA